MTTELRDAWREARRLRPSAWGQYRDERVARHLEGGEVRLGEWRAQGSASADLALELESALDFGYRHVLLLGERGTGKSTIARAVADHLRRALTPVNCAVLPPSLAEAELFGSVKGAYTGASRDRPGLVGLAQAGGREERPGVLFLDEFFDAPPDLFPGLLLLLQERTWRKVGGEAEHRFEGWIVAASNRYPTRRSLDRACDEGRVRADLIDRFELIVEVPPLCRRREEIAAIAAQILEDWETEQRARHVPGVRPCALDPDTEALLATLDHNWPGNVRELRTRLLDQVRYGAAENGVLRIPRDVAEAWAGGASSTDPAPGRSRGERLAHHLREEASRATGRIDARWVGDVVRRYVKQPNASHVLKASTGRNATDWAAELAGLARG